MCKYLCPTVLTILQNVNPGCVLRILCSCVADTQDALSLLTLADDSDGLVRTLWDRPQRRRLGWRHGEDLGPGGLRSELRALGGPVNCGVSIRQDLRETSKRVRLREIAPTGCPPHREEPASIADPRPRRFHFGPPSRLQESHSNSRNRAVCLLSHWFRNPWLTFAKPQATSLTAPQLSTWWEPCVKAGSTLRFYASELNWTSVSALVLPRNA